MDDSLLSGIVTLVLLILLHSFIVLSYAALTNTRQSDLREWVGNNDQITVAYPLSLNLTRFGIAAVTILTLGEPLVALFPAASSGLIYLIVIAVIALLTMIVGDLVPAAIDADRADLLAPMLLYPMRLIVTLLSPLVWLIVSASKALSATVGTSAMVNAITEAEIMTMLDASQKDGTIEDDEREMLFSVLRFDETLTGELMVPRIDVVGIEIDTTFDKALAAFINSGHSRIPIYNENMDDIRGVLYAKDMLSLWYNGGDKPQSIAEVMRPAHFVPENMSADQLLRDMQTRKVHMAVVIDEYGGTAGIVTIEDLIEEIVGDIQDEYDPEEEAEYFQISAEEYVVDAGMNFDDFQDLLDIELETEDSNTLGGYIYAELGHVPEVGEVVENDILTMKIESVELRRIRKVRVIRKRPGTAEEIEEAQAEIRKQSRDLPRKLTPEQSLSDA